MDTRTAIKELKKRIKDLSSKQRPLKRARKTSVLPHERLSLLKQAAIQDNWLEVEKEQTQIASGWVRTRQAMITASLNLYHELRGLQHRHGHGDEYLYRRADEELRSELLATQ